MRVETDDAGGGRRGLRAAPSPRLFDALRAHYGVEASSVGRDLGGSSSLNLLVTRDDGPCVARVYRPCVTPARLDDIQAVRRRLAAGGVPMSQLLPTRDLRPWVMFDGRLVEVERYVERDADMDCWERLQAGLPLLGRIHARLRGVAVSADGRRPAFANHIEPDDALAGTLRGTGRIRGWDPSPGELALAEAAEELARRVSAAEQDFAPVLPRQLVHGDYWDNNVFFRNGKVVLVTDLDFMGERARIDDLALTLYYANAAFPGDRTGDERMGRLRALVDAYDGGLDEPLAGAERAGLPLALARQPLWGFGVWVAQLDDERRARQHARGMAEDVAWALRIVRHMGRWQAAFA